MGTSSQLLDVALGLAFIFFALSLVCSVIQELIATALSWRAELLERGIRRMLCDPAEPQARMNRLEQAGKALETMAGGGIKPDDPVFSNKLLESPFVREKLSRNLLTVRRAVPSYLSSRTFALALFDTLTRHEPSRDGEADPAEPAEPPSADMVARLETGIAGIPHKGVRRQLQLMLADAEGNLEAFHTRVEAWFDDTMQRVSGWYRRRAQVVLFVIGLFVAAGMNADTIDLTNRLWTDGPVRAALVQQASQTAEIEDLDALEAELEKRGGKLEAVKQFNLPLGWTKDNGRISDLGFGKGKENLFAWLAGILVAAVALSFGAPFWFEALGKIGRLRVAGRPPKSSA